MLVDTKACLHPPMDHSHPSTDWPHLHLRQQSGLLTVPLQLTVLYSLSF